MDSQQLGFGLLVTGDVSANRTVQLARAIEAAGFTSLWFADTLFYRSAIPRAAAAALMTSRLRIGLGVLNPFNRHPTLIAMEAAALDEVAGGRVVLGLGASVEGLLSQAGIEYRRPLGAVRDSVQIVRQMLSGQPCVYEGARFSVRGAQLSFTPPRANLPIYVGAVLPKALALCGDLSDGLIVSLLFSPSYTRAALERVAEGARRAGRDVGEIDVVHYTIVSVLPDDGEARALARPFLGRFLVAYGDAFRRQPEVTRAHAAFSGLSEPEFEDVLGRLEAGEDPQQAIPDPLLDAFAIAGAPERCAHLVDDYRRAGVKEVVGLLPAGADHEAMIQLIGERVIPSFGAVDTVLSAG